MVLLSEEICMLGSYQQQILCEISEYLLKISDVSVV
jgi:hypothetical protein